MTKTFDELWRCIMSAIDNCKNVSDLQKLRITVMGKNGIFKQIEKALWK